MRILTSRELGAVDADAKTRIGLPTLVLMENAGRAVAEAALEALCEHGGRIFIVCGKGHNGGDGWSAARLLQSIGTPSTVVSLADVDQLTGDPRTMADAALRCGPDITIRPNLNAAGDGDVIVDALFGTGLHRAAEGRGLQLIQEINAARQRGAWVISVDLPSGLDADVHHPIGPHVIADETVTLHALKWCLAQHPTRESAGRIRVAPIGIPPTAESSGPFMLSDEWIRARWNRRQADAHKGTAGHVLVVAGSDDKSGAAALTCRAALRSGAGLVTLAAPRSVLDLVLKTMPEVMAHPLETITADGLIAAVNRKQAFVIGPGIARTQGTGGEIVEALRRMPKDGCPVVLDADALNAIAEDPSTHAHFPVMPPIAMTPHPAELARLLGSTTEAVQSDRVSAGKTAAAKFGCTIVVKGAASLVVDPSVVTVNPTGTQAMATAGSGDVLSGLIGGLIAQGVDEAARVGVYLHGSAGENAANGADRGLLAHEIADAAPHVLSEWS